MKIHWIIATMIVSLALVSCGQSQAGGQAQNPNPPTSTPLSIQESSTSSPENPIQIIATQESKELPSSNPPPVEKFVDLSKKDLTGRFQISTEEIVLVKSENIVWPNAALGCPAPGKVYAQGKVPGFQIWLEAGGQEYIYHTDFTGQIILCPELNPDNPDATLSIPSDSTQAPNIGVPIK